MAENADLVVLERSEDTSVTVHLHGATVTSWKCGGQEMIFVSKQAVYDNKKAIRGGIPVVFPNFGPWDLGPQHGFARISRWTLSQSPTKDSNGDVSAVLALEDTDNTRKMWNHKFKVTYTLTLKQCEFQMDFAVENTGPDEFDFTCLLHTYFHVPDVTKTTISGLKGLQYSDKVRDGQTFTEDRDLVSLAENYDRVYINTPPDHTISNVTAGKNILLKKSNFPDTVVWNPWMEKAKAMSDFGDDEYPNMLCVEAGYVTSRYKLSPSDKFEASQTLTVTQ
ncbi:uncharacterized protein [Ptychodera flava]|uniref:uncharacterized protein n=1 Tax=Ptychodera flava TaxID=63121 RepID=UPI00396AA51C